MYVGVPQGSVLAHLTYILCINDILCLSTDEKFFMYADDTTVFISEPDESRRVAMAANLLQIHQRTEETTLSINSSKLRAVFFDIELLLLIQPISFKAWLH